MKTVEFFFQKSRNGRKQRDLIYMVKSTETTWVQLKDRLAQSVSQYGTVRSLPISYQPETDNLSFSSRESRPSHKTVLSQIGVYTYTYAWSRPSRKWSS